MLKPIKARSLALARPILEKFFFAVSGVCLFLAALAASVFLTCFDASFYNGAFAKHGVGAEIGVSYGDLARVADGIIKYLSGASPALDVSVSVNGRTRLFFNEKERAHMSDVRGIARGGFALFAVSAFIVCATFFYAAKTGALPVCRRVLTVSALCAFGVFAVLCGVCALNFDRAFTMFHKIFFKNDLWLLDPATDLLINIMPIGFFMDAAARVSVLFAVLQVAALCAVNMGRWVK